MPRDKYLHMIGGAVIMAACLLAGLSQLNAMMLVSLAAAIKEALDAIGFGTPEWLDAHATVAGGWWVLFGVEVYRWVEVWT